MKKQICMLFILSLFGVAFAKSNKETVTMESIKEYCLGPISSVEFTGDLTINDFNKSLTDYLASSQSKDVTFISFEKDVVTIQIASNCYKDLFIATYEVRIQENKMLFTLIDLKDPEGSSLSKSLNSKKALETKTTWKYFLGMLPIGTCFAAVPSVKITGSIVLEI